MTSWLLSSRYFSSGRAERPGNSSAEAVVVTGGAMLTPAALAAQTDLGVARVSAALMMLELKRAIGKRADGTFETRG